MTIAKRQAPYGSWPSPLTAERLAASNVRLGQVAIAGTTLYWNEGRPAEGGRNVVVACDASGACSDLNPPPFDARSRVHEYGGGAFAVARDGELFFSHDADRRLYRHGCGDTLVAVADTGDGRAAGSVDHYLPVGQMQPDPVAPHGGAGHRP